MRELICKAREGAGISPAELAEQFYGVLLQFTKMINDLTSQLNKLRDQFAELLEIDSIG